LATGELVRVLLELFAGTRSIGRVAEEMGWEVFSTDIYDFEGIDLVTDILDAGIEDFPIVPDVIWASPPCTTFSVASIGTHWGGGRRAYIPKTDAAWNGIEIVRKTLAIIDHFPEAIWFIENPRGLLRRLPVMATAPRRETVTYCQYGDSRMKPTDIWTNCWDWVPRPRCYNNDPCHVAAPRGSKTGTQGLALVDRSRIPEELCREILEAAS
jgi:hypothetical protein